MNKTKTILRKYVRIIRSTLKIFNKNYTQTDSQTTVVRYLNAMDRAEEKSLFQIHTGDEFQLVNGDAHARRTD